MLLKSLPGVKLLVLFRLVGSAPAAETRSSPGPGAPAPHPCERRVPNVGPPPPAPAAGRQQHAALERLQSRAAGGPPPPARAAPAAAPSSSQLSQPVRSHVQLQSWYRRAV